MSDSVTSEGRSLIDQWTRAKERLRVAESEVNKARCDVSNTENALGKWLMPHDAQPLEKIAVWDGDSLIQVIVPRPGNDPIVSVRTRGKRSP